MIGILTSAYGGWTDGFLGRETDFFALDEGAFVFFTLAAAATSGSASFTTDCTGAGSPTVATSVAASGSSIACIARVYRNQTTHERNKTNRRQRESRRLGGFKYRRSGACCNPIGPSIHTRIAIPPHRFNRGPLDRNYINGRFWPTDRDIKMS